MDIIGACESEGYDFVTKNDNVYVFEDEHNYVFVDTTEECVADGSQNYLSVFDFNEDFSTLSQGYVTMTYNIREDLAPGRYVKNYHMTTVDEIDNHGKGIHFSLEIDVKKEGNPNYEYGRFCSLNKLRISSKPGDSVAVQLEVDHFLKGAKQEDIVLCAKEAPFTTIFPAQLEFEREVLNSRIDRYKQYPSFAERYFPEGVFETLTQHEYDHFIRSCEKRVEHLRMVFNDAHVFVYNKESGNIDRQLLKSTVDEDGNCFGLIPVSFSGTIDALDLLPFFTYSESDKASAERIISHLDELGYDIHARNATGQMFDAFKSAIVKEIKLTDIKPDMVIAKKNNTNGDYSIFEVTDIVKQLKDKEGKQLGIKATKNSGFTISVSGDLDTYSSVEASYDLFHDEPNKTLYSRDTYFELDKSAMGAVSLLDKVAGDEHKSSSTDKNHKINRMIKAVQEEINEERGIQPMFEGQ